MNAPILVSYATRGGSTAEVAEAISLALNGEGLRSIVQPVEAVESLEGFNTIILGAPLYIGRFPKPFHRFLVRHRDALRIIRPWIFVLGPTRPIPSDFDAARRQAHRQLGRHPWLQLVEVHIFGGRFDLNHAPQPLTLLQRLPIPALRRLPTADIRDWVAIRAWSRAVALNIKSAA